MKKASAELQVFWVITFNIDIKQGMYCIKLSHYYVVILKAAINWKSELSKPTAEAMLVNIFYLFFFFYYYSETVDFIY